MRSHLVVVLFIAMILSGTVVANALATDMTQTARSDPYRSTRLTTTSGYLEGLTQSEMPFSADAGYSGTNLIQSKNTDVNLFSNKTAQTIDREWLSSVNEIPQQSYSALPDMNSTDTKSIVGTVLYGDVVSTAALNENSSQMSRFVERGYLSMFSAATVAGIKTVPTSQESVGILGVDPSRPPPPTLLTKAGHWFPNKDYSRIRYEVYLVPYFGYVPFYIHIDRVQDPYGRYFRVFLDGTKIYEGVIYSNGFDGTVSAYSVSEGTHTLTLEIQWGYYSDHGWKLLAFSTDRGFVTGEFFPRIGFSKLRWDVYLGSSTQALVDQIISCGDPYLRFFRIYVDGVKKVETYAPVGHTTFDIGDYTKQSLHEVAIEVQWGDYLEWGWKTKAFYNGYAAVYYEVDYMPGHQPDSSIFSRISEWYMAHGYQRPVFVLDTQVPHEDVMLYDPAHGIDDYTNNYYNVYFGHINQVGMWKYVLFGHYDQIPDAFGWTEMLYPSPGGNKIFVADQKCDEYASNPNDLITETGVERLVLMHEGGHSINIIEYYPQTTVEKYCTNGFCVMAGASEENCGDSYYCSFHWGLRQYPS